jgi:uncharacterized protein YndB with AHSA1/START domain
VDVEDRELVATRPHGERGPGGGRPRERRRRIYERTPSGERHDWGEVTVWEPPRRLSYLWHIGRERATATEVEITFVGEGGRRTRIEIEHSGWEALGDEAEIWRDKNRGGWDALLPHFVAAGNERD